MDIPTCGQSVPLAEGTIRGLGRSCRRPPTTNPPGNPSELAVNSTHLFCSSSPLKSMSKSCISFQSGSSRSTTHTSPSLSGGPTQALPPPGFVPSQNTSTHSQPSSSAGLFRAGTGRPPRPTNMNKQAPTTTAPPVTQSSCASSSSSGSTKTTAHTASVGSTSSSDRAIRASGGVPPSRTSGVQKPPNWVA